MKACPECRLPIKADDCPACGWRRENYSSLKGSPNPGVRYLGRMIERFRAGGACPEPDCTFEAIAGDGPLDGYHAIVTHWAQAHPERFADHSERLLEGDSGR